MIRSALALALALALTACGGSTAPPPAKTAKVANDAPVAGDSKPVTALRRADVRGAIYAGLEGGALTGFVSGSGPTIAFLVADADSAESLAQKLHIQGYRALAAAGPAVGAFIREEN